jgi:hypothetical protein
MDYIPELSDLEAELDNKVKRLNSAVCAGQYLKAEQMAVSAIETLQQIQRLKD